MVQHLHLRNILQYTMNHWIIEKLNIQEIIQEAEAEEEEDEGECTFDGQNNSTDEIYDTDTCDSEDEI